MIAENEQELGESQLQSTPQPPRTTPEPETPTPVNAPGRVAIPVEGRAGADTATGKNAFVSWGARSDVGLVRSHNEDSFLVRTPCFAVCDGMGGHAAGEVASAIAVKVISEKAPATADDTLLGAAVEAANSAIIDGAANGEGKPGMGCTASVVLIEGSHMAVAHVGDSRIYLLHAGSLVRITRDHSYVEELVDAGQITADEARVHPSRSIITRALGSDPDMYADHFSLDVTTGDRVIVCSDGLSSMVPDDEIEALAISSATPQQAADNLVSAALTAGGADNVTVVVVDVINDGIADANRQRFIKHTLRLLLSIFITAIAVLCAFIAIASRQWYLAANGDTVGIYQGVPGDFLGISTSQLVEETAVEVDDLPSSTQSLLEGEGIRVNSEEEALATVQSYRDQIDAEKTKAAQTATEVNAEGSPTGETEYDSTDANADASTDTSADTTTDQSTGTQGGE